jgi:hypothetical protein
MDTPLHQSVSCSYYSYVHGLFALARHERDDGTIDASNAEGAQ